MPQPTAFDDTDLLDASNDLPWRDGCDAVSIRDLETALGLKAPSLYRRVHSRAHADGRTVPGTDPDSPAVAPLLAFEGLRVLSRAGRPGLVRGVDQLRAVCVPVRPASSTPDPPATPVPTGDPVPTNRTAPIRTTREETQP